MSQKPGQTPPGKGTGLNSAAEYLSHLRSPSDTAVGAHLKGFESHRVKILPKVKTLKF